MIKAKVAQLILQLGVAIILLSLWVSVHARDLKKNESIVIDFDSIPFNQSIKVVKGNGSKKIAVFYEIDCNYCKNLEKYELSHVDDVTIYNFLFVNEVDKNNISWKRAESIWCSKDIKKAWDDFIFKDYLAMNFKSCVSPLEQNKDLALKLGVKGTPTLFFSNGTRSNGMIKAKEIHQRILDADFYNS